MNAPANIPSIFQRLAAEFPREAVHWRAQSVTKQGDKALALAYLDARDVQDRFDAVCGPDGWRNSVSETPRGRVLCTIEVRMPDGEWVGKTDGAGDTAVEGEKGALSDAFKRSAVLWGVGRYLYRLPAQWVPCESSDWNGKKQFKAWKVDPWSKVPSNWKPTTYQDVPPHDPETGEITTGEEAPKKRAKLENGPYSSKTALWTAVKLFDRTVRGCGDMGELLAYLETKDVQELIEQCKLDAPGLWSEGLPDVPEYVPMEILIADRKRELEELEGIKGNWRENPVNAG